MFMSLQCRRQPFQWIGDFAVSRLINILKITDTDYQITDLSELPHNSYLYFITYQVLFIRHVTLTLTA